MTEKPNTFVVQIDTKLANKLLEDLKGQGFEISNPEYTLFSARKKGLNCTLYTSGKLVVQGKEKEEFIEFYLEPQILGTFAYTHKGADADSTSRIGIDESGKGDFFGPLCVAGVFAEGNGVAELLKLGVRDSKDLSDKVIMKLAKSIRDNFQHQLVKINPAKYNELYQKFGNLNHLLAWGHATTIEELSKKSGCRNVIVDQFADESLVIRALQRKSLELNLTQRHRAEEDPVVAAASILARDLFLLGLRQLGEKYDMEFPKGASSKTIEAGRQFVAKYGREALVDVCKKHFKTLDAITS